MKINYLPVLSLFLFIVGCDSSKKSQESPASPGLFTYEIKTLTKTISGCESQCTNVSLAYPVFSSGLNAHESINILITHRLKETISGYMMQEVSTDLPLDSLVSFFFQGYRQVQSEFPESNNPWYLKIDVIVSYIHNEFVSLSMNTSSYTGGAHSNKEIQYINLDKTGKEISSLDYFVKDKARLTALTEKRFREKHHLAPDADLAEAGFIFDDNAFQLTSNFGFTSAGMIFYYNSYEIAPYAEGPTVLIIPYEELPTLQESHNQL